MKRTPSRPMFFFWLLGLAALVVSTTGAIFALHGRPEAGAKTETTVAEAGLICYGNVDVESGLTPLYPLQPGRVVEVLVQENDKVRAGNVLLMMDDRLATQRLDEAQADLAAATAQWRQAQRLPEQHAAKVAQQQAVIEAMQQRLGAAEDVLTRKKELVKGKQLNPLEQDVAAKQVEEARAGVAAETAKLRELNLIDFKAQMERAKADMAAKRAKVDQAQLALDECVLRAPEAGEVLQVNVSAGSVLGAQSMQPAIQFCPDRPRIVRAEVEQEFTNRVRPNQPVTVQNENGSKDTWKGKVARMTNWYTLRRSSQSETLRLTTNDVRILECIVVLDAKQPPLRLGQRMRVTMEK